MLRPFEFCPLLLLLILAFNTKAQINCPDPSQYYKGEKCDGYCEKPHHDMKKYLCKDEFGLRLEAKWDMQPWGAASTRCLPNGGLEVIWKNTTYNELRLAKPEQTSLRCAKQKCTKPRESKEQCYPQGACTKPFRDEPFWSCNDNYVFEGLSEKLGVWTRPAKFWCEGDKAVVGLRSQPAQQDQFVAYRCREDRGCKIEDFFDRNHCDLCRLPTLSADSAVLCDQGKLQVLRTKWEDVETVKCDENMLKVMENGTFTEERPPQIRCKVDPVCEINLEDIDAYSTCSAGQCSQLMKASDNKRIICDPEYGLEAWNGNHKDPSWVFITRLMCSQRNLYLEADNAENKKIPYTKFRCRKWDGCDLAKFFDETNCANSQICKMPDANTLQCSENTLLEYTALGATTMQWIIIESLSCESNQRFKVDESGTFPENVVDKLRCRKDKRCSAEYYYDANACNANEECDQPAFDLQCYDPTKSLQFRMEYTTAWEDADFIKCDGKELIVHQAGKLIDDPAGYRCAKVNVTGLYDPSDCDEADLCEQPTNQMNNLTCPAGTQMQVKMGANSDFTLAHNVSCKKSNCTVDGMAGVPERIRCVKRRCSTCTNPCPSCNRTIFSTAWNQCVTIRCDSRLTMLENATGRIMVDKFECVSGDPNNTVWKTSKFDSIEINDGEIQCRDELQCTVESKLFSDCHGQVHCQTIDLNNDDEISCIGMKIYHTNGDQSMADRLRCDKNTGKWLVNNQPDKISKGDNVYCEYEGCDNFQCDDCIKDEREDVEIWSCPENSKTPAFRIYDDDKWKKFKKTNRAKTFECTAIGQLTDEDDNWLHGDTQVYCGYSAELGQRLSAASVVGYSLLGIFGLIAVVIIGFYCFCWMKHEQCFHQVVKQKLRERKERKRQEPKKTERDSHKRTSASGAISVSKKKPRVPPRPSHRM